MKKCTCYILHANDLKGGFIRSFSTLDLECNRMAIYVVSLIM
jgi:hypothetical protein